MGAAVPGKVFRNCDECSKPSSCTILGLRQLQDPNGTRYVFYLCENCLQMVMDIAGETNDSLVNILSGTDAI